MSSISQKPGLGFWQSLKLTLNDAMIGLQFPFRISNRHRRNPLPDKQLELHLASLAASEKDCLLIAQNLLNRKKPLVRFFPKTYWQQTRTQRLQLASRILFKLLPQYRKSVLGSILLMELEEHIEHIVGCCGQCLQENRQVIRQGDGDFYCPLAEIQRDQQNKLILDEKGELKKLS